MAPPKLPQLPPEPLTNQFAVTIAADVPPGVYDVRAIGTFGISNPRSFVVGTLPEVKEQGGNNTREKPQPIESEYRRQRYRRRQQFRLVQIHRQSGPAVGDRLLGTAHRLADGRHAGAL